MTGLLSTPHTLPEGTLPKLGEHPEGALPKPGEDPDRAMPGPGQEGRPEASVSRAVPVLYIACMGRSGSTLLERILGTFEGFCTVGELRFIWERSFGENQLCGCGVPFDQCPFWDRVSRALFGVGTPEVDASRPAHLRRSLDDFRHAPWLVQSRSPARRRSEMAEYGKLLGRLYRAILEVSGQRAIVDSTGDATHGLILSRLPEIDLHVVHLVRDSRAVAFSWKRARRRPEIHWRSQDMPIERVSTSAMRWTMNNLLAERLSKSAASYRRLRYEDFVADPDSALAEVLSPCDWAPRSSPPLADVVLRPTHTVSGNPIRFQQGPIEIRADEEWRRAMAPRDRLTATAMTWWLLARYRYPLRTHV
jgi:hypothetical protein